jgi:fructose-1,6-bisphosphatase II / sedoheptulose-1,7-bisphosphatase
MHDALRSVSIEGTIRIGEGIENEVQPLCLGEKVGSGSGVKTDVAVVPLEGSTAVARGDPNALCVFAMAEGGGFLNTPDVYMDKLAIGSGLPEDLVDLDEEPGRNLRELARAKGVEVGDLVACILDRPRHAELIARTRKAGARIMLIADGDISGVIATDWPQTGVDIYMGVGGAPHGVLAAAALVCVGGQMQGRLLFPGDQRRETIDRYGIERPDRKYSATDMASGDITFSATGITTGPILLGVRHRYGKPVTHSLVLRSSTHEVRCIETHHGFSRRPGPGS